MDPSKLSFQRFRNILRLAQPKPLERHFTLDQLFAISLDVLNENALLSIRPGEPREHDSRAEHAGNVGRRPPSPGLVEPQF